MSILNKTEAFSKLALLADELKKTHLRELFKDENKRNSFFIEHEGIMLDYSRQKVDHRVLKLLFELAEEQKLGKCIEKMFKGAPINVTENRMVLHFALRFPIEKKNEFFDPNILEEVHKVLTRIKNFSNSIRDEMLKGYSKKPLTDVVCVGIGGSYLGTEFVYEALKSNPSSKHAAQGRTLKFLANVDPIDVDRAISSLNPETTLVIIISKTFTTVETMLNAKTLKSWILNHYNQDSRAIASHMCAVSTNLKLTHEFGIADDFVFPFWDWVGGRYSVTSSVGVLPLACHYGWEEAELFLKGCHSMDMHFFQEHNYQKNLPVMMGLLSLWNSTFLKYNSVAILPYCQGLCRFPAHIQQLTMESNGKGVTTEGEKIENYTAGEIYFGEVGTNGQHSFYQLLHQGRVIPAEFIGFCKSQNPINVANEPLDNHDELMSNFFAQPDALAFGKTKEECMREQVDRALIPHKVFLGDRPSMLLLFEKADAYNIGRLLSLYEHRTAVQGFIWQINSFDQYGVELGKVLASNVRDFIMKRRNNEKTDDSKFCSSTLKTLGFYTSK